MNRTTLAPLFLAALALPAHAANTSCDAVLGAGIKQVQTPHLVHSSTKTSSGKVTSSEAIFIGSVEYLQVGNGNWRRSSMRAAETLQDNAGQAQAIFRRHLPQSRRPDGRRPSGDLV